MINKKALKFILKITNLSEHTVLEMYKNWEKENEVIKEDVLKIIKEESEKADVRHVTNVNGFGYSQFERDLAGKVIARIST